MSTAALYPQFKGQAMNYQLAEEEGVARTLPPPANPQPKRHQVTGTLEASASLQFGPVCVKFDYDGRNILIMLSTGDGLRYARETRAIFRRLGNFTEFPVLLRGGAQESIHIGPSHRGPHLIASDLAGSIAVVHGDNRLVLWPRRRSVRFIAWSCADYSPVLQQPVPLCICGQGDGRSAINSFSDMLET
jgi:hypothetical protein